MTLAFAKQREMWDRIAVLRLTIMQSGLSGPKRLPKPEELNPLRQDESDEINVWKKLDKL
jgi:hypothetical protein